MLNGLFIEGKSGNCFCQVWAISRERDNNIEDNSNGNTIPKSPSSLLSLCIGFCHCDLRNPIRVQTAQARRGTTSTPRRDLCYFYFSSLSNRIGGLHQSISMRSTVHCAVAANSGNAESCKTHYVVIVRKIHIFFVFHSFASVRSSSE